MAIDAGENGSRISRVELTSLFVPFREGVRQVMQSSTGGLGMAIPAQEPWTGGDFVICKLLADDGTEGMGEAFVWLPETGVLPEQIISIIRKALHKYVLGESPFNIEDINRRMDMNVARNEVAKGLLDIACYDLMGRLSGKPVSELIGGRQLDEIPLAALIPLTDLEEMVNLAMGFYESGFRTLRVKLGGGLADDVQIIEEIRDALGDVVRLRVDYNQAYEPEEAVHCIKAIERFAIDCAEQPVAADDYPGMAWVQKRVDTPLMAHEGCFSLTDITALVELGAIGVVGINAERPGGITKALQAIEFARDMGMGVVIHNQTLGVASAAQLHIAAARHSSLGHDVELFGHVMFEEDLIIDSIDYRGGTAIVPDGPGLGVALDERAVRKYREGPTVVI
jgi:muconate cycloisomerase